MSTSPIQRTGSAKTSSQKLWQGDQANGFNLFEVLWRRSRQLMWGGLLLAALLLFAWLIWLLLLSPKRTTVVVLTAAPYSWPLPPNAWAREDLEKLKVLDGETLTLRGDDSVVLKATDFFERLDREIARIGKQSHHLPLVVWVNLHGIAEAGGHARADGQDETDGGAIHLIPPKASPTDPDSWIDFNRLLDRLAQVGNERKTLLVLDCNRIQVNWNVGLTANRFAEKVEVAYRRRIQEGKSMADLAVLLSAGPDEKSHASPILRATVFGHFMQLGLAGAADDVSEAGNGDGWVELSELHRYVSSRVWSWTQQGRGVSQRPVLLTPESNSDFRLARSLNAERLVSLTAGQAPPESGPSLSSEQLDSLWRSLDEFREDQLYRREPIAFRELEHQLLWLEQLSVAGKGYGTLARRTFEQVKEDIETINTRRAQLTQEPTFTGAYSILSGKAPSLPRSLRVHSLPLAEFFGTQDLKATAGLREQLAKLAAQPDSAMLSQTRSDFETISKSDYHMGHFVRMVDRYQTPRLWQRAGPLGKLLQLQSTIEDFAVPRNATGIPSDIRLHRWNRVLLGPVDESRRRAEDSVFLRRQDGLEANLETTRSRFSDSVAALEIAGATMRSCDHAMKVTPYFAQWVAHPNRVGSNDEVKRQIDGIILPLITDTLQLAAELDQIPAAGGKGDASIESIRAAKRSADQKITPVIDALENQLVVRTRELLRESLTNELPTIGAIEAALAVPLVDWESRRDLRAALGDLMARVEPTLEPLGNEVSSGGTGELADASIGYSTRVASWQRHPLDLLLESDGQPIESSSGNRIGRFLASIRRQMERRQSTPSIAEEREICGEQARRTRGAASIWFPELEVDPIEELRRVDLKALLLWHAQRTLADFWGPAGGRRSFYDLAASDYCESVAEMDRSRGDVSSEENQPAELRETKSRLVASRSVLPKWLSTTADRTIQLDPNDDVRSTFLVRSELSDDFIVPSGTGAIVVRGEKRRIDLEQVLPNDAINLPAADSRYVAVLPAEVAASESKLKAQTIFRGHEFGGSLNVEQLGGVRIDVSPHRYQKSEVTLNGPWDSLSVVFVLDCSASMAEILAGEPEPATSRMEVAKAALQEMLLNLGLRRQVRVGVRAFGHRLGWSVDEPVKPLTRPDYTGAIDPTLNPAQDVESLFKLDDFDLSAAQSLVPEIVALKPWGQSPLYLSVLQSLEEFSAGDAESDRHVIVITDGANYQFIPRSVTTVSQTTDDDVRAAWVRNQVPVHILGLGMDRAEQQDAVQAFDRLSRDTGGRFQALGSGTDLAQAIRNLLSPGLYRLRSYQDDDRADVPTTLGSPTRVAPAPESPEFFGLQYEGRQMVDTAANNEETAVLAVEPIVLEGGEAYQLYVNEAGTEIFDFPYDDNMESMARLVSDNGSLTEQVVRLHRPQRRPPDVCVFPISWQRKEPFDDSDRPRWRATRRPSEVWIQIQPVANDGQKVGQAYTFFDATFEPDEPVPVMNLVASRWPGDATRAKFQVWSRPPKDATTIELLPPAITTDPEMESLQRPSNRLSTTIAINESSVEPVTVAPGITVRLDPLATGYVDGIARRRFVVEFADRSIPVTSIKVSLPSSMDQSLTRVLRQFDAERGIATHTFSYATRRDEPLEEIRVSNRAHEIDGAWRLERDEIEVAIPDSGGLLPLGR